MRDIDCKPIIEGVRTACIQACTSLPDDVMDALKGAREAEESPVGVDVIDQLIENADIARREDVPICQDTGFAIVFVELGQDAHVVGGDLYEAINEGVRQGYQDGYLRKSIARHPLDRVNTRDNTPAVIHTSIVPGDGVRITVAPKGAGSENMSVVKALKPADGIEGVTKLVVDTVVQAGPNPCPPLVVGVGIGGTLEKAAILSKKAICRDIGSKSDKPTDAQLETSLLEAVNATGVGPSGFGGRVTALAVHVESYPCHIASLPVAVTLQCHAARHKSFEV